MFYNLCATLEKDTGDNTMSDTTHSPASLDPFAKLLAEATALSEARKSTKHPKPRGLTRGKREKTDIEVFNEALDRLLATASHAHENWPVTALVYVMEETHCKCGAVHVSPSNNNLFLHHEKPRCQETAFWDERFDAEKHNLSLYDVPNKVRLVIQHSLACFNCLDGNYTFAEEIKI
jgi:hypothetical protein